jgi:hypothetical protein
MSPSQGSPARTPPSHSPGAGRRVFRLALVGGEAPGEEWTSTPSLIEVAEYGAFPDTFAGPGGQRHPPAVERFDISDPDETSDGPLQASWGRPTEGAEQAYELLIGALQSGGGLDRRGRALAGYAAGHLAADATDLLRIVVAAEPGGPALDDELHLLTRRWRTTWRLSLASAPIVPDTPVEAGYRIACVTTLLGEFDDTTPEVPGDELVSWPARNARPSSTSAADHRRVSDPACRRARGGSVVIGPAYGRRRARRGSLPGGRR